LNELRFMGESRREECLLGPWVERNFIQWYIERCSKFWVWFSIFTFSSGLRSITRFLPQLEL